MKALIVHDSDEVKACFIGKTDEEIIEKLKKSEHWEDVVERLLQDPDEREEQEPKITMSDITSLFHDGDSEDGYTLIDAV